MKWNLNGQISTTEIYANNINTYSNGQVRQYFKFMVLF